jgi:predicted metalloendopeptidase
VEVQEDLRRHDGGFVMFEEMNIGIAIRDYLANQGDERRERDYLKFYEEYLKRYRTFDEVKEAFEKAETLDRITSAIVTVSENGAEWKHLNVARMVEVEEKFEKLKKLMIDVCEDYVTELCQEGLCDCDPNGWEGCLTRKILELLGVASDA